MINSGVCAVAGKRYVERQAEGHVRISEKKIKKIK